MAQARHEIQVPVLRFAATSDLVLHERHDVSRSAPPVVAPIIRFYQESIWLFDE